MGWPKEDCNIGQGDIRKAGNISGMMDAGVSGRDVYHILKESAR